jgi:hypothetical protein
MYKDKYKKYKIKYFHLKMKGGTKFKLDIPDNYPYNILEDELKFDKNDKIYDIKYRFNYVKYNNNENIYLELIINNNNNHSVPVLIYKNKNNDLYAIIHLYSIYDNFKFDGDFNDLFINKSSNEIQQILNILFDNNYLTNDKINKYYKDFEEEKTTCDSAQLDKQIDHLLENDPEKSNYQSTLNYFSYASGNLHADIKILLKLKENNKLVNLLFNDQVYNNLNSFENLHNDSYINKSGKSIKRYFNSYSTFFLENYLRQKLKLDDSTKIYFTNNINNSIYISKTFNIKFNYCISIQPQGIDYNFEYFYKNYCINSYKIIWCDDKKKNLFIPEQNVKNVVEEAEEVKKQNYNILDTKTLTPRLIKEIEFLNNNENLSHKPIIIKDVNITINVNNDNIKKIEFILSKNYPFIKPIIKINNEYVDIFNFQWTFANTLNKIVNKLINGELKYIKHL